MKSVDYIAVMLFGWTCAIAFAACMVVAGIPWAYALAHTLSACVVGTISSGLLLSFADFALKRWQLPSSQTTIKGAEPKEHST